MHIIQTKHLSKTYTSKEKNGYEVEVLKDMQIEISKGEYVGIMGKSGSGKTTLLNIIGSLDTPTKGNIFYYGENYTKMNFNQIEEFRRKKVGYVFQDFRLVENLKLEENIILPMLFDDKNYKSCIKRIGELAEKFGIEPLLGKYPHEISGGEKQRVAICRALINNPDLILADEPTGNLDSQSAEVVVKEIGRINSEMNKTVIVVTHDPHVASHCNRVIFLKDGEVLDIMDKQVSKTLFYDEILRMMQMI